MIVVLQRRKFMRAIDKGVKDNIDALLAMMIIVPDTIRPQRTTRK